MDGLLPMGEVSLLGADGGTGKGIWQAQLIAYVTAGRTSGFFPQPPEKTGSVLLFSGEDDPGKVLKARLTAAGADMSRVMVVTSDAYFARTGSPLCIPDTGFAKYVGKAAPALVIIDPLQSFLPAGWRWPAATRCAAPCCPSKPSAPSTAARPSSRCTPTSAPTSRAAPVWPTAPTSGTSPAASS